MHGRAIDAANGPARGDPGQIHQDHDQRRGRAADFTYVATWTGFVSVAFVIDAYARLIVGWRASRTAHAGFVLDALE